MLYLVAVIKRGKNIIGYRFFDTASKTIGNIPTETAINSIINGSVKVENITIKNGNLQGIGGAISRYAEITLEGNLISNSALVILDKTDVGYLVVDFKGQMGMFNEEQIVEYSKKNGIANGKIVKDSLSAIEGSLKTESQENRDSKLPELKSNQTKKGSVQQGVGSILPSLILVKDGVESLKQLSTTNDTVTGAKLTVDQKMLNCLDALSIVMPFYYSVYIALEKIPIDDNNLVEVMAVSTKCLYYNTNFVRDTDIPQVLYVIMHEILHIAMQHSSMLENRDAELWNIAGDFLINATVSRDFKAYPGKGKSLVSNGNKIVYVEFPNGTHPMTGQVMPMGLFHRDVDPDKDSTIGLYNELLKNKDEEKKVTYLRGQEVYLKQNGGNGSGNGSAIGLSSDLISDETDKGMTSSEKELASRSLLAHALEHSRRNKSIGSGESNIERLVKAALAPKIKWRTLVRSFLISAKEMISSYSSPDRRFIHSGNIFPGNREIENKKLDGIKTGIDTSGSISDKDLAIALDQLLQLLKMYNATGEILYWDDKVRGRSPFTNTQEVLKSKPKGGGGTDPVCVFETLLEDYKKDKESVSLILMFTDGHFYPFTEEEKKKFAVLGRKTIWIISEDSQNTSFEVPFGRKALFDSAARRT